MRSAQRAIVASRVIEKADFGAADIALHPLTLDASNNPFMQSLAAMINTTLTASFMLSAPRPTRSSARKIATLEIRSFLEPCRHP